LAVVGLMGAAVVGFDIGVLVLILLFLVLTLIVGQLMKTDADRSWLPAFVLAGFAAKVVGAALRFGVFQYVYLRQADAGLYHGIGSQLAYVWRSFNVPSMQGARGAGTRFVEVITGLLYAPYIPDIFGGFLIFAMLGFGGQLLFYAAFRRALPDGRLKLYAALVLFLPGLVFWPASIGKDAVMLLFLGLAAYGGARLFERYHIKWVVILGLGMAGAVAVRPHVAALLAAAFAGASRCLGQQDGAGVRLRKLALMAMAGLTALVVLGLFAERFGLNPEELQLDPFLDELARRTQQGGSAVEGRAITSIGDVPQAVLRVVFRPLIYEGFSPLALASGVEGTALLLLVLWKLPRMIRNVKLLFVRPYLMFSFIYVAGFVVVFSPVLNLGILARQRTQMLPMLLALIVGLGWPPPSHDADEASPSTATPAGIQVRAGS
jgi:hypothetical protein